MVAVMRVKLVALLLAYALTCGVASPDGEAGREGKGGKGGRCKKAKPSLCLDGSKPQCADGSLPSRDTRDPTCEDGGKPVCADVDLAMGDEPTEAVQEHDDSDGEGRRLRREDGRDQKDYDDGDCGGGIDTKLLTVSIVASVVAAISVVSCLFCWRRAAKLSQVKPKVEQVVVGKAVNDPVVDVEGVVVPGHAVRDVADEATAGIEAESCVGGAAMVVAHAQITPEAV